MHPLDTEKLRIEKITVAIYREDIKVMLAERMKQDNKVSDEFAALIDKYCSLFGFLDWLQAYRML